MHYFLIFVPISIVLFLLHANPLLIFIITCVAIVPLAAILGDATENLAHYTGDKIGGMMNATMGNVPELLIGLFAINAGLFDVVKATIIGSILGNLLLVLGASILIGGMKFKVQTFNKSIAKSNFVMLSYAMIAMLMPGLLALLFKSSSNAISGVSNAVAILLLVVYLFGLFYALITHKNIFTSHEEREEEEQPEWSKTKSIVILAIATVFVGYESEILVDQIKFVIADYHVPAVFIGIIIIPIVGNVAEHAAAMIMAYKNRMDIALEIGVGSATQIALFVGPVLLLASIIMGNAMDYVFPLFQLITIFVGFNFCRYVFHDGKTTWIEGLVMISTYVIMAVTYYFI